MQCEVKYETFFNFMFFLGKSLFLSIFVDILKKTIFFLLVGRNSIFRHNERRGHLPIIEENVIQLLNLIDDHSFAKNPFFYMIKNNN